MVRYAGGRRSRGVSAAGKGDRGSGEPRGLDVSGGAEPGDQRRTVLPAAVSPRDRRRRPQPAVVRFRRRGPPGRCRGDRRPWRNFPPISARRSSPGCGAAFPSRKSPASAAVRRARSIAVINAGLRPCEKGSVGHVQRRKRRRRPEGIRAGDGCAPPAGRPARPGLAVDVGQGGFPDGGARGSPEPSAGESGPLRSPGGSSVCLFALWRRRAAARRCRPLGMARGLGGDDLCRGGPAGHAADRPARSVRRPGRPVDRGHRGHSGDPGERRGCFRDRAG